MAIKTVSTKGTNLTVKLGTATAVKVGGVKDFSGLGGGSTAIIDATDLDSTAKEKLMGLPDEGTCSFSMNYQPTDAGQAALETARGTREVAKFELTLGAQKFAWDGFVTKVEKSGGVDALVALAVDVEITGPITVTAVVA